MAAALEGDTADLTLFLTWPAADLGQLAFSLSLFLLLPIKHGWLLTQTPYNKRVWSLLIGITANSYLVYYLVKYLYKVLVTMGHNLSYSQIKTTPLTMTLLLVQPPVLFLFQYLSDLLLSLETLKTDRMFSLYWADARSFLLGGDRSLSLLPFILLFLNARDHDPRNGGFLWAMLAIWTLKKLCIEGLQATTQHGEDTEKTGVLLGELSCHGTTWHSQRRSCWSSPCTPRRDFWKCQEGTMTLQFLISCPKGTFSRVERRGISLRQSLLSVLLTS